MPTRRRPAQEGQLAFAFPQPERPRPELESQAESLVALNDAVRLTVAIAEGRVARSAEVLDSLHESLGVLAAHDLGGRLGHVVRRYRAQPVTRARWSELVDELAFVLSLTPGDAAPESTPTRGGTR